MPDRRFFLRLMLYCLAATAAAGVGLVFFESWDVAGRVAVSALAAAVAAGLMVPLSGWIDRAEERPAGVAGMALVLLQFILALAAIWWPGGLGGAGYYDLKARLWGTNAVLTLTGWPAIVLLHAVTAGPRRYAARAGLALCATEMALWLAAVWTPWSAGVSDELAETGGALALCGLPAACCVVGFRGSRAADGQPPDRRHWRWLGVAASAAVFALLLVRIWFQTRGGPEAVVCLASLALVVAHANLMLLVPLPPGQAWLRRATLAGAIATALIVDAIVVLHLHEPGLLARLAAATAIATLCGSLAIVVLARIHRPVEHAPQAALPTSIELSCPHCGKRQRLPLGGAACAGCRLLIFTRVAEPRCPRCEYSLINCAADACPECGAAIGE